MSLQSARLAGAPVAGASPSRRRYVASVSRDWREIERDWRGDGTAFQSATWLSTWYEAIAPARESAPLLVTVRDAASEGIALHLPLILRRDGGLTSIEFADLGLTDFNAPFVGPAGPVDRTGIVGALRAVRRALPPADLLRLVKMPGRVGHGPNPLAGHPGAVPSALNANPVRIGDDYDAWRRGLGKTHRKEMERSWRVFLRAPDAGFEVVTDPAEAREVMTILERQQGERMRELGNEYLLDDPDCSRFYGNLVARGVADGRVVVARLRSAEETVAAIVGIHGATGFVFIRISNAGSKWSSCSPGRLVLERTMAHLHGAGHRLFDFSIGNYDYKRRFGVERLPLFDYIAPLSFRGLKAAIRARFVGRIRSYPKIDARLRKIQSRLSGS